MTIVYAGNTHQGCVRTNNEDSFLMTDIVPGLTLLLVADGVGGHASGEVASQTAVAAFEALVRDGKLDAASDPAMRELLLEMAVQRAHIDVAREAKASEARKGMACTLTAVVLDATTLTVAQVGDTRLYRWSASDGLQQLTKDQTVAALLVERGQLAEKDAETHPDSNVLAQAIGLEGTQGPLRAVIESRPWSDTDRLLICSDGLSNMVSDEAMASLFADVGELHALPDVLINAALDAGGRDNVTVIVAGQADDQ